MTRRMPTAMTSAIAALGMILGSVTATSAQEDSYPEREIQLVIPYSPGGATDVIFRLVSEKAEKHLGTTLVPVNMAGAGATRGSRHVKDAEPDGYTLLGSHDTIALSNLAGMVDYSYDAFEPIALLTQTINIPATNADNPVENAGDIADYVKENPGEVSFGMTPSSTDHFFWAQFFDAAGIDMDDIRFVGYPGTGDQVSALLANEIDFAMLNLPSGGSYFENGSLRPLGVAHDERLGAMPDTPTLREQGIELDNATSRGIFAPKGTPQERLDKVADAFGRALEDEELRNRIENELGSVVRFLEGEEYQEFLDENEAALARAAENLGFEN